MLSVWSYRALCAMEMLQPLPSRLGPLEGIECSVLAVPDNAMPNLAHLAKDWSKETFFRNRFWTETAAIPMPSSSVGPSGRALL